MANKKPSSLEVLIYSVGVILLGLSMLLLTVLISGLIYILFKFGDISLFVAILLETSYLVMLVVICKILYKIVNPSFGEEKDGQKK